jgi:hypothetical protein
MTKTTAIAVIAGKWLMAADITESKSISRFQKNTLPDGAFHRHPSADVGAEVFWL